MPPRYEKTIEKTLQLLINVSSPAAISSLSLAASSDSLSCPPCWPQRRKEGRRIWRQIWTKSIFFCWYIKLSNKKKERKTAKLANLDFLLFVFNSWRWTRTQRNPSPSFSHFFAASAPVAMLIPGRSE